MFASRKFFYLPIIALLVIVGMFVLTSPVHAEDAVPPVSEAPAETQPEAPAADNSAEPPVVESAPVEVSAPPEAAPETPVEVIEPSPTETPVENTEPVVVAEPQPQSPSTGVATDLQIALGEQADLVVVNQVGEEIPLATQESGEILASGDPYFTVGSVTYQFFKSGSGLCGGSLTCFESATPIQAAIDYMSTYNLTPTDRKLYIEADTYNEEIYIDGSLNGVKGLSGLVGLGATPEDVQINGYLFIYNFLSGFSVSNLSVTNSNAEEGKNAAIWAWDNKGTLKLTNVTARETAEDGTGILIYHNGPVEFNGVTASNNGYIGARIWNSSTGLTKITNSTFDNNLQNVNDGIPYYDDQYDEDGNYTGQEANYSGLEIWSGGPISLNGVTAIGNIGDGAGLRSWNNTVTVKNSVFNDNDPTGLIVGWGDGLYIGGNSVILENIQADNNNLWGIHAEINSAFSGKQLQTDSNVHSGVYVDSCWDFGDLDPFCDNTGAGTVTISYSSAENNGLSGFEIQGKGAINISNAYSANNTNDGYLLDNTGSQTPTPITADGTTAFSNDWSGLTIFSKGAILVKNFQSTENGINGVYIENTGTGTVTITNTKTDPFEAYNAVSTNGNYGYYILSKGAVTITNLDANNNIQLGGYIDNSTAPTAAPVTINTTAPSGNTGYWENGTGGLFILSRGAVTLSRVGIENNGGIGAEISNIPAGTLPGVPVTITDSYFSYNNAADGNSDEDGLRISSKGLVTLTYVRAHGNDGIGITIDNHTAGATAGVTINTLTGKGNAVVDNTGDGLVISTNGAVMITNIYAARNFGYGVSIANTANKAAVTIKQVGTWTGDNYFTDGNNFSSNELGGLYIDSNGAVTVDFFNAIENGESGIDIGAEGGTGAVTVKGAANFSGNLNNNGINGIRIDAQGNITLANIDASGNTDYGAYLDNDLGKGTINLTNAYFAGNNNGLTVLSQGSVIWKNGGAFNNFNRGIEITNIPASTAGTPVSLTNIEASNNGETGIFINSKGIVTLTNVASSNNSANNFDINYGHHWTDNLSENQIWKFDGSTGEDVTIKIETPNFNPSVYVTDKDGNYVDGVTGIDGSLILTFELPTDGEYQIHINNTDQPNSLYEYDLWLYEGSVPFLYIENESSANGIYIDNQSGNNAGVTITNPNMIWNGNNSGNNVVILTTGAVSLKNLELNDSGQSGLQINNTYSTGTPGITLANVNAFNNSRFGTEILSDGAVIIKDAMVGGNHQIGLYVSNQSSSISAPITFTNLSVDGNSISTGIGLDINSKGAVTFTNVWSGNHGGSGIDIDTDGAVTLTQVSAGDNDAYGLRIDTAGAVTMTGTMATRNRFYNNALDGLYISTNGKVALTFVSSGNNTGDGLEIHVSNPSGLSPITLTNVYTNGNNLTGTNIYTTGAVTVTSLTSSDNVSGYGIYLDQSSAPTTAFAVLLNKITTQGNGFDGIYVWAKGAITTNNIISALNHGNGVNLINTDGVGGVTMLNTLGANSVYFNDFVGINIQTNGAVTLTGLEIFNNGYDGLTIRNDSLAAPAVTLNSVISRYNGRNGIYVESNGIVTGNNSYALSNGWHGIRIETTKNVFLNNTSAINNGQSGFNVLTPTAILKLTNCTWFGNLRSPVLGDKNLMTNAASLVII